VESIGHQCARHECNTEPKAKGGRCPYATPKSHIKLDKTNRKTNLHGPLTTSTTKDVCFNTQSQFPTKLLELWNRSVHGYHTLQVGHPMMRLLSCPLPQKNHTNNICYKKESRQIGVTNNGLGLPQKLRCYQRN